MLATPLARASASQTSQTSQTPQTPQTSQTSQTPQTPQTPQTSASLLSAFKDDSSPLATAIQDLLNDPSKEAADALIKRLPDLIPEDPALAAVIAEEMAKAFGQGS